MRIISVRRLEAFWSQRTRKDAEVPLRQWTGIVQAARWQTFVDAKATFGKRADIIQTNRTQKSVVVFDFAANKYRMVAAVHFNGAHPISGRVYILRVFTHAEYGTNRWKDEL